MRTKSLIGTLLIFLLILTSVFAYSGFNRYYYTNTYGSSVYYPTPAYTYPTYYSSYSSYYYPTYYTVPIVYPTYSYTYVAPSAYVNPYAGYAGNLSYYSSSGWGISIGYGSLCGYYGYC